MRINGGPFLGLLFSFFIFQPSAWGFEIIAFHGLNQSVRTDAQLGANDCSATKVNTESHNYIENTIPSQAAAFQLGATIGHFNLRRTADPDLVVFHDPWLWCRTNVADKTILVRDSKVSFLKNLDVGYGYTPDGITFPVRGLGVGLMPTFKEVLTAFPNRIFVINDKDADSTSVDLLVQALSLFPAVTQKNLIYLGEAAALVRQKIPTMKVVSSTAETKICLLQWKPGSVPSSCKSTIIALPLQYVKQMGSKISSFIDDLHHSNSTFWIFDVNSQDDAKFARTLNIDAVGTYRIDQTIGALTK